MNTFRAWSPRKAVCVILIFELTFAATGVQSLEDTGVTILGDEGELPGCIERSVRWGNFGARYIDSRQVRDSFYPWLEPAHAPRSLEALHDLMSRERARDKLNALGLRYIISMESETEQLLLEQGQSFPREVQLRIRLHIWDTREPMQSDQLEVSVTSKVGEWTFGFKCFFHSVTEPCLKDPETEKLACKELAPKISEYFAKRMSSDEL